MAEAECRRAAAAAEEVYVREFNQQGTPAEADALLKEHQVSPVVASTVQLGYYLEWVGRM